MVLIDTHNHLDFPAFDGKRAGILEDCRSAGIIRQVMIGVHNQQWCSLLALCASEPDLYAAPGLHPLYLDQHDGHSVALLGNLLEQERHNPKLCAVGEVGLDYYERGSNRAMQKRLFQAQLDLCLSFERPALLHVRRAHRDTIEQLKQYRLTRGGIVHAFSGSYEEAKEYLRLGFKIGLGGAGTWPQALRMHRVLQALPMEAIVLETDAPDIPPASHPEWPNSPVHLADICYTLARIKGIDPEVFAEITTRNACALFHWPLPE